MTGSTRALCLGYGLAALFLGHCAAASARADAWWYGVGLFVASLLLLGALGREFVAAEQRRASSLRAERAARLGTWQSQARADLYDGCCERWWTSCGTEHDTTHCTRKDQAA
ncbi:hypothetical protein [Streptomyces sp. I5]|uniref:hypothetical protein n=1 Tax=Streptomyces sp. I5 TaxID=2759947 RepID=UPI0018EE9A97|nr:hypothetical protein [Streptomyces sp. I5]MBJ6633348.1 hypothetical protein [Streptomyces sp. I5]